MKVVLLLKNEINFLFCDVSGTIKIILSGIIVGHVNEIEYHCTSLLGKEIYIGFN